MACYGAWPIVATNHYTYATAPVETVNVPGARSSIRNTIWTNENSTSTHIYTALDYLSADMLSSIELVQRQGPASGAAPVKYSVNLEANLVCPIAYIGTS